MKLCGSRIGFLFCDALFDCLVFAELDVVIIKYISFCFKFYFSENTDTKNPATSLESSKYRTHSSWWNRSILFVYVICNIGNFRSRGDLIPKFWKSNAGKTDNCFCQKTRKQHWHDFFSYLRLQSNYFISYMSYNFPYLIHEINFFSQKSRIQSLPLDT